MSAAEFLAEAAALLRERAGAVPVEGGVWLGDEPLDYWVADFVAIMDPGVALALADWLDGVAGEWSGTRDVDDRALAVAAAILGRANGGQPPEIAEPQA